eukprot:Skav212296  [mRNA]  locus=scaffold732:600348:624010:- [translate_table: standard]
MNTGGLAGRCLVQGVEDLDVSQLPAEAMGARGGAAPRSLFCRAVSVQQRWEHPQTHPQFHGEGWRAGRLWTAWMFCQLELQLEGLPDWTRILHSGASVQQWKEALVTMDGLIATASSTAALFQDVVALLVPDPLALALAAGKQQLQLEMTKALNSTWTSISALDARLEGALAQVNAVAEEVQIYSSKAVQSFREGLTTLRAMRLQGTAAAALESFEGQRPSDRRFVLPHGHLDLGSLGSSFFVAAMDADLSALHRGLVTNDEFGRFATRALDLTEGEAEELLTSLCQQQLTLTPRQLDALSFDVQLPGLRLLLRDAEITPLEWTAGLQLKQSLGVGIEGNGWISSSNALDLFQVLDPGGLGLLSASNLRILVGQLSLCDYRELLRSELGNFSAVLAAADGNADLKVLPAELLAQAAPYCISETDALMLHARLDVLSQGFIDLFAFSSTRPRLFGRLDPLGTGQLSRRRFESAAATVTLSGLRLVLFEVAPGGQADLLQRADIDQGGTLSSWEFIVLGNLLGLSDANALQLFGSLRLVENDEFWGKAMQGHPGSKRLEDVDAEASNFLGLIDSSGNGRVERQELETWALYRLALPASSLSKVRPTGRRGRTPSVVVLRALLASRQEYALLTADSDDDDLISPQVGVAPRLELLDINEDGFLQRNELLVASAPELKLFDFRRPRHVALLWKAAPRLQELQLLGCRRLALKGDVTSAGIFRAVDLAATGEARGWHGCASPKVHDRH